MSVLTRGHEMAEAGFEVMPLEIKERQGSLAAA